MVPLFEAHPDAPPHLIKEITGLSCDMKNEMIIAALETPEEKELYHAFAKEAECHFQEHKALNKQNLGTICKLCRDHTYISKKYIKALSCSYLFP